MKPHFKHQRYTEVKEEPSVNLCSLYIIKIWSIIKKKSRFVHKIIVSGLFNIIWSRDTRITILHSPHRGFFGCNLLPIANFLKLTKTYQFMWVYNSDIHKRYIWEFRPVKVILNIVWHCKWATYINLFYIWRQNHSVWFGSKCQPP